MEEGPEEGPDVVMEGGPDEEGPDRDPRVLAEPMLNAGGSFDGLFSARRVPMVRLATLLVGSPAIAEEVVQDAFAAMSERWDTVDWPDAYLRRSVINGCAGVLRRRTIEQRYRDSRLEVADDEIPEQLIDLRTAVDRLTDRQRLVVVLRYFADLRDEEIAEALGVRPGTVRSLAHRAIAALRGEME